MRYSCCLMFLGLAVMSVSDAQEWGGDNAVPIAVQFHQMEFVSGTLKFSVEEPCFIRIRFGVHEGPCLETVENWQYYEIGTHAAKIPIDMLKYFDESSIIASHMAISFSPTARYVDPVPLTITSGTRFGHAPRYIDLMHCAKSVCFRKARDCILNLKWNVLEAEDERNPYSFQAYLLNIDIHDSDKKQQFLAEHSKMMVYFNSSLFYGQWDTHLPCSLLIDPKLIGYSEGILTVNLYTMFDRLAIGTLPFTNNWQLISRNTHGVTP